MLDLLAALPVRVWLLLAVSAVIPMGVGVVILALGRRRIATTLATRTVGVMGVGVAVLAAVATLSVLQTGLREIRRRQVPAIVALASELAYRAGPDRDSLAVAQQLGLFRSREAEVGAMVAWFDDCAERCMIVAPDLGPGTAVRAWASRTVRRRADADAIQTVAFDGEFYSVLSGAVRDVRGIPVGRVAVAVHAEWVADQAVRTVLLLVGIAYALLFAAWWLTRRIVAVWVADRVTRVVDQMDEAGDSVPLPAASGPEALDELSVLATRVRDHVAASIGRLREADRRAVDAAALADRITSTSTLAAGVAHDFNNLMMGVTANCEVLKLMLADTPKADAVLTRILDCAERGGKLAQQMLAFARGGRYNPTVLDLNDTVEATIAHMTDQIPDTITVRRQLAPGLPAVHADPTQLSQVVKNLVLNAVEAIDGPGEIRVETGSAPDEPVKTADADDATGPFVFLAVRDTGAGMSPEIRARIFDPFFTTKVQGRGMGLAAVYGIVTNHGGRIVVADGDAGGTEFRVYLPPVRARRTPDPARPDAGATGPRTVLLVDDEPVIVAATKEMLERGGYTVLTAANGIEAIQQARESGNSVDAIVLDMRMPVMSGPEAFSTLVEACPRAKVLVSSGFELDQEAEALLNAGAAGFLQKPFRSTVLIDAIDRALGTARGERAGRDASLRV